MLKELFRRLFQPEKSNPAKDEKAQSRIEQPTVPAVEPHPPTSDDASSGNDNGEQQEPEKQCPEQKEPERETSSERQSDMSPIDFQLLAKWCSMGHLPSMWRMSEHFEAQISEEVRHRLYNYLIDPDENQESWDTYLEAKPEDCFNVRAYTWWLCRLAQFGEDEAKEMVEKYPKLETMAFMRMHPLYGKPGWQTRYYPGGEGAARLGLLDLAKAGGNLPDRKIDDGIYRAEDYSGYSGPDETGFGMEEEYNFYYFDEYYRLLNVLKGWSNHDVRMNKERILDECREERDALRAEREVFLKEHAHDPAPV